MVPAMVVRRWVTGKREMRWMPERPAQSAVQFSFRPTPSEEPAPMPVTATTGRPMWSRRPAIVRPPLFSTGPLDQAHAFAAPDAPARRHHRVGRRGLRRLEAARLERPVEAVA